MLLPATFCQLHESPKFVELWCWSSADVMSCRTIVIVGSDSSAAPVFQCTHELHPRLTEMMRAFTRSLVNPRHHISQRRTSVVRRGVEELTPLADVSRTTIGRQISVCRLPDRSAHRSVGSDGDEIYLRTDSPSWITVTSFGPKEWRGGYCCTNWCFVCGPRRSCKRPRKTESWHDLTWSSPCTGDHGSVTKPHLQVYFFSTIKKVNLVVTTLFFGRSNWVFKKFKLYNCKKSHFFHSLCAAAQREVKKSLFFSFKFFTFYFLHFIKLILKFIKLDTHFFYKK